MLLLGLGLAPKLLLSLMLGVIEGLLVGLAVADGEGGV